MRYKLTRDALSRSGNAERRRPADHPVSGVAGESPGGGVCNTDKDNRHREPRAPRLAPQDRPEYDRVLPGPGAAAIVDQKALRHSSFVLASCAPRRGDGNRVASGECLRERLIQAL